MKVLSRLSILVLLVVAIPTINSTHSGYDLLNQHLEQNVDTKDVEENLDEVEKLMLEVQRSEGGRDSNLIDALYHFIELKFMKIDDLQCDGFEMSILAQVSAHCNVHKFNPAPHPEDQLSRVEWIVYKRSLEHAQKCLPDEYLKRFNEIDSVIYDDVAKYVGDYVYDLLVEKPGQTVRQYMEWLAKWEPIELEDEIAHAIKHMRYWSSVYSISIDTEYNFKEFLKSPCQKYARKYGPDLFEPAIFDLEMYESLESAYDLDDENLLRYFKSMATYKICEAIGNNQELERRVIRDLRRRVASSSSGTQV